MATERPTAVTRYTEQAEEADRGLSVRRDTLVMVRWALIMACAYLILFGEQSSGPWGLGVIGAFLASNLLLGRLPVERLQSPQLSLGVGAADSVLIASSLYLAGQLSVELLVLFLGILVLAIAGLRLATIATVTLGMTLAYMGMVWLAGSTSPWQSSLLLRAPFLLGAALLYGSLADSGAAREYAKQRTRSAAAGTASHEQLSLQCDAIRRCQQAAAEGASGEIRSCLEEIAACNQAMQRTLGAAKLPISEAPGTSAVARSAA